MLSNIKRKYRVPENPLLLPFFLYSIFKEEVLGDDVIKIAKLESDDLLIRSRRSFTTTELIGGVRGAKMDVLDEIGSYFDQFIFELHLQDIKDRVWDEASSFDQNLKTFLDEIIFDLVRHPENHEFYEALNGSDNAFVNFVEQHFDDMPEDFNLTPLDPHDIERITTGYMGITWYQARAAEILGFEIFGPKISDFG